MNRNNMQIPNFLMRTPAESAVKNCTTEMLGEDHDILRGLDNTSTEVYDSRAYESSCVAENSEDRKDRKDRKISPMEREALIQSIKGLSPEQIDIVLDNIPIEMVYNRIGRELERNKAFIKSMRGAMALIEIEAQNS